VEDSSSASGYGKGLRSDDKSMRVLPWSQFQLVGQESDQLAFRKKRLSSRSASFVCFGCASARLDTASHLKVGYAKHHGVSSGTLVSNKGKYPSDNIDDDCRKVHLKSSLKRQRNKKPVPVEAVAEHEASGGKENYAHGQTERRRVQWTDACGRELVQIQEFEPRLEYFIFSTDLYKDLHTQSRYFWLFSLRVLFGRSCVKFESFCLLCHILLIGTLLYLCD